MFIPWALSCLYAKQLKKISGKQEMVLMKIPFTDGDILHGIGDQGFLFFRYTAGMPDAVYQKFNQVLSHDDHPRFPQDGPRAIGVPECKNGNPREILHGPDGVPPKYTLNKKPKQEIGERRFENEQEVPGQQGFSIDPHQWINSITEDFFILFFESDIQ